MCPPSNELLEDYNPSFVLLDRERTRPILDLEDKANQKRVTSTPFDTTQLPMPAKPSLVETQKNFSAFGTEPPSGRMATYYTPIFV